MSKGTKRKNRRSQKMYVMRGCNKTNKKSYLGGNGKAANLYLAYPSNIPTIPTPNLAYVGGGDKHPLINTYAKNPIYPSSGPPAKGFDFFNPQVIPGGAKPVMKGGCGGTCPLMKGGSSALVGKPWTATQWPASKGMPPGQPNHFPLNTYNNDISRQMKDVGAAFPYTGGRNRRKHGKTSKYSKNKKGGTLSNFVAQDLINLGRQFQSGVGNTYNTMMGYANTSSPLPWKGQLVN